MSQFDVKWNQVVVDNIWDKALDGFGNASESAVAAPVS